MLCAHFKECVTLNQVCHTFSEWQCFQFIAHQLWRSLGNSFTSATCKLTLLICILGLFWYLLLYLFTIYDNKIELCFSQTIALKSWSCLELFLFLQRSAEEFLWLLVKVALYCLSGKDFCLLSRMAYNHL